MIYGRLHYLMMSGSYLQGSEALTKGIVSFPIGFQRIIVEGLL